MNCNRKTVSVSKIRRWGLPALSVFFFILLAGLVPIKNGIVLQGDRGILTKIPIESGDYFEMQFRHSVNRGLVIERYEVDGESRSLSLVTGWFESYGAGMTDTIDDGMKISEDRGMLRIDFPSQEMKQVVYRPAGIAGHRLMVGEKNFLIYEHWGGQAVRISVGRLNSFEYLKYLLSGGKR